MRCEGCHLMGRGDEKLLYTTSQIAMMAFILHASDWFMATPEGWDIRLLSCSEQPKTLHPPTFTCPLSFCILTLE